MYGKTYTPMLMERKLGKMPTQEKCVFTEKIQFNVKTTFNFKAFVLLTKQNKI